MERDDDIEKISKELEDMLKMTSDKKYPGDERPLDGQSGGPARVGNRQAQAADRPLKDNMADSVPGDGVSAENEAAGNGSVVRRQADLDMRAAGEPENAEQKLNQSREDSPAETKSAGDKESLLDGLALSFDLEGAAGGDISREELEENSVSEKKQKEIPDFILTPLQNEEYEFDTDEYAYDENDIGGDFEIGTDFEIEDLDSRDSEGEDGFGVGEKEEHGGMGEEGRAHSRRGGRESFSLIRPSDGLAASFFVPIIIMLIIFAQRGIFPFGEESFLRTDMYHQYAPFFSEFQYKLTHGGSLLYSWDVGMGVNFMALYAYYLASPLNWLLALCPKPYIIEFMTYMIVFKTGLCGLSFAWYLRKHCKTTDFGVAFFGIFYALSGYMAAYSWNIMWLDCIILFPLIMLGLERLVKEKKCFLYCITLGLSILSNYYISIMICIFMVLYFVALLIMEKRKTFREYAVSIGNFALYSLLAGGLAAAVLLPEIYALNMTASGKFNFPKDVKSYFSIFDMIARHLPDVETEIGLEHWPNIYCGVAVLMFFLLYLVCRRIKRREKIVYCGLLLFLFASFSFNVLNFIWHGFHFPNSLPCRQSFIYIALMLLMCYQAYSHLKETPWKHVVTAFFAAIVFVLMAQKLMTDEAYHFSVFYVAIVLLSAYTGLICLYQQGKNKNLVILLALGVVSVEAAVNMTVTSVTTTSRTNYVRDNEASVSLTEPLKEDMSFYRVEKVSRKTKNDGAFMNFPSVSLFSSAANADLSKFFKKLGCESSTNAYSITGSTPLVDALFSVKYGLYSEEPPNTGVITPIASEGQMYLYQNDYALPMGLMFPYDLEDNWQLDITNPADVQNDLAAVLGAEPVLDEVPSEILGTTFTFTPETTGDYYIYVSNKKVEKVTALMGERTKNFDNVKRGYLLELGWLQAGEEITLRNDDNEQDLVAMAYRFRPEGLQSVYQILNKNSMVLTKWTDTELRGRVETDRSGLLYLSIPYDKGWTVLVDGKEEEPYKIFDTFMSVSISAGTHEVELRYMPEGLEAGALITAGCILVLAGITGVSSKRKKKTVRRRKIKYKE